MRFRPRRCASPASPSEDRSLYDSLSDLGGGVEFRLRVALPLGSGLGTSSILAAAVVRALAEMRGFTPTEQQLSDEVMRLEQTITTGGGWQDQAGGIYPGAKLLSTGPGSRQRIRVQPVAWSETRRNEFLERLVLYNTGIRRIAKNLLRQVVRSYLAREVATVQVLHSIKTLAAEMAYAMAEGEWDYLGELLDRHWELNKVLDPNTTNAPINALLDRVRPLLSGAKLAGAGGGGFLDPAGFRSRRSRTPCAKRSARVCSGSASPSTGCASPGGRSHRGAFDLPTAGTPRPSSSGSHGTVHQA